MRFLQCPLAILCVFAALSEASDNPHRSLHGRSPILSNPVSHLVRPRLPHILSLSRRHTLSARDAPNETLPIKSSMTSLGDIVPPLIEDSGDENRPYGVKGNNFQNKQDAVQRACAIQHNDCADGVNDGAFEGNVGDCDKQMATCMTSFGA